MQPTTETILFQAIVIPGKVDKAAQTFSIDFALNPDHAVFGHVPRGATLEWKNDVLFFPDILQLALTDGRVLSLSGNFLSKQNCQHFQFEHFDRIKKLWASFLGYGPAKEGKYQPRDKSDYFANDALFPDTTNGIASTVSSFKAFPTLTGPRAGLKKQALAPAEPLTHTGLLLEQLSGNPVLQSVRGAVPPPEIVNGIGDAHTGLVQLVRARNERLLDKAKAITTEHPELHHEYQELRAQLVQTEADMGTAEGIKELLDFYKSALVVVNEPNYIREGIDKLNSALTLRKFSGTLLDFSLPVAAVQKMNDLQLTIDLARLVKLCSSQGIVIHSPAYFDGSAVTKTERLANAGLAPTGIKGYDQFYINTSPRLKGKSKAISFEAAGVAKNQADALSKLNENPDRHTKISLQVFQQYLATDNPALQGTAQIKIYRSALIDHGKLQDIALKLNNQISNVQTKGHQLYLTDPLFINYDPNKDRPEDNYIYTHDLVAGYIVFVRITRADQKKPLLAAHNINAVNEKFNASGEHPGPVLIPTQMDAMVHAVMPADPATPSAKATAVQGISNGYQFTYDGTTISSQNPLRHYENGYQTEKERITALVEEFIAKKDDIALETLVLKLHTKKILGIRWFPYPEFNAHNPRPAFLISRKYQWPEQMKVPRPLLQFSRTKLYSYALAAQFHNGHSLLDENTIATHPDCFSEPEPFLRHDHIKAPLVSLMADIYQDKEHKVLKDEHLGESNVELVVRDGDITSNGHCSRYILPPQVPNFQVYLWYDYLYSGELLKSRALDEDDLHSWYLRYQCEIKSAAGFKGCRAGCNQYCGGTCGDLAVYDDQLPYLPEPVVTGFVLRFFYDSDCHLPADSKLYPETYCRFRHGGYPALKPWKMVLKKGDYDQDCCVDTSHFWQTVTVRVAPGRQVFAAMFSAFDPDAACMADPMLSLNSVAKNVSGEEAYYYDLRHCGIEYLTFTHATQQPVFKPTVNLVKIKRYKTGTINKLPSTVDAEVIVTFEHPNIWNNLLIPGEQPTGEMDVYMLWDDYSTTSNGKQKSMVEKEDRNASGDGHIYVGKIEFNEKMNSGDRYEETISCAEPRPQRNNSPVYKGTLHLTLDHAFDISYYTDARFRVRDAAKYSRFFQRNDIKEETNDQKEPFSLWSDFFQLAAPVAGHSGISYTPKAPEEANAAYLFNNTKPAKPVVEKIIPLIVKDEYESGEVVYYQRVRIYFSKVPLTGKDNRIALLINDSRTFYPSYLKDKISRAGVDVVTDGTDDLLTSRNYGDQLIAGNFNMSPVLLEGEYLENFKPLVEQWYKGNQEFIGVVSYTLLYDKEQRLSYIDVELKLSDISHHELHNPFVQFYLAAYQPYSANYGFADGIPKDNELGFNDDYRLSDPVKAEFFSVYPSRTFKNPLLLFRHNSKEVCSLSGNTASLFRQDKQLYSDFILCVQAIGESGFWENVPLLQSELHLRTGSKQMIPKKPAFPAKEYQLLLFGFEEYLLTDTDFELSIKLGFDKHFLKSYRVVIFEVDCFNGLTPADLQKYLAEHDEVKPDQVFGVRKRGTYIFND